MPSTIKDILDEFKQHHSFDSAKIIEQAYQFAEKAHRDQKRKSGESYIHHCLETAMTLAKLRMDAETIAAGLLHDVLDDTKTSSSQLRKKFGENVLNLAKGVSKVGKIRYHGKERMVENLRRLFLAMAKDIRVILIKLSDRLHNMETLDALPAEKQKRIALETLEIYAPIANRLGIREIRGDLEDLSFKYVYPKEYQEIVKQVKDQYIKGREYLRRIIPIVKKNLAKKNIRVIEIHARTKHYYSLYRKLLRYEMDWVKQLQEWQNEKFSSPEEYIDSLKIDFLKDRIFVFTPKGDIFDLPEGATPIDFAYKIHTDVGNQCAGAKVDEKLVSLSRPLQNGEVVEIITQKNKKPNRDWL